jgi:hypothetical protein
VVLLNQYDLYSVKLSVPFFKRFTLSLTSWFSGTPPACLRSRFLCWSGQQRGQLSDGLTLAAGLAWSPLRLDDPDVRDRARNPAEYLISSGTYASG